MSIRFADDGGSLAPAETSRVWTPYYQGEKHFTGKVRGLGLGLPMVASLIWRAGGSCRIGNLDPGPGVYVDLEMPYRIPSQSPEQK